MAKENKSTDNVELLDETLGKTELFYNQNKSLINKILIGIIILLGGYILVKKMYIEPQETEAQEALFEAQYVFEKDSFASATGMFQDIVDQFGSTKAGNTANLYLGISLMKQNKFDEALEALNDFSGEGYFIPTIKLGLVGDCYSELGEWEKAVDQYEKAAESGKSKVYSPYYLKKAGILLEQNNEPKKAQTLYEKVLSDYYYEDIAEFAYERREIVMLLERAKAKQ